MAEVGIVVVCDYAKFVVVVDVGRSLSASLESLEADKQVINRGGVYVLAAYTCA